MLVAKNNRSPHPVSNSKTTQTKKATQTTNPNVTTTKSPLPHKKKTLTIFKATPTQ
jgi:hypothetical protein